MTGAGCFRKHGRKEKAAKRRFGELLKEVRVLRVPCRQIATKSGLSDRAAQLEEDL